jgi:hypothetical protein
MELSRPLILLGRERARRTPVVRPANRQIFEVKAWPGPKPAAGSDAVASSAVSTSADAADAEANSGSQRRLADRPLVIGLIAAVAVNFGAGLGFAGWGALQALGLVAEPAIETVQHEQAAAISRLDETVNGLTAAVAGVSARVYSADQREDATGRRMAEIDASLGVLRSGINELRAAQNAAEESWREPVAELKTAAAKTHSEIVRLRASVDELKGARQPEVAAIGARIDRIEHAMVEHNLLGPMRGPIHEPAQRGRPPAAPETSSMPDGHIINLAPAR